MEFNGYFAVRGTTDKDFDFIDNESINLFFGNNSHLVTYSINKMGKKTLYLFLKIIKKLINFTISGDIAKKGLVF